MIDGSGKINTYYWYPLEEVNDIVTNYCKRNNFENILEIGPGIRHFELATKFIGYNEKIKDYIELDIDTNLLPFENKSLDFVYSRHTLEDIQNPDFAMREIIRVSKSGYIETPSPLIEMTKGVDEGKRSNYFCGYIHHRYIIWSDIEKCEIYFLPKYNSILDHFVNTNNVSSDFYENKFYWNNYFIWNNRTPKIIMYKNGVNIGVKKDLFKDYFDLLYEAVNKSVENTNFFLENHNILD